MVGIGIAGCASCGCSTPPVVPPPGDPCDPLCCVDTTSIALWFLGSASIAMPGYVCDECPDASPEPFQVILSPEDCELVDFVGNEACDFTSSGSVARPAVLCGSKCFTASFSTDCQECVPTDPGDPLTPPLASRVDYTILAFVGKIQAEGVDIDDCETVLIAIIAELYTGEDCASLSLCQTTIHFHIAEEVDCCGLNDIASYLFETYCCTPGYVTGEPCFCSLAICTIDLAAATMDHPEWGQVELICE